MIRSILEKVATAAMATSMVPYWVLGRQLPSEDDIPDNGDCITDFEPDD